MGRLVKFLIALPVMAMLFSVSPAYAGKDKTDDAWVSEVKLVKQSVKDKGALGEIAAMVSEMNDGWGNLDRSDFYALASINFKKLSKLSAKHGGPKITTPGWID